MSAPLIRRLLGSRANRPLAAAVITALALAPLAHGSAGAAEEKEAKPTIVLVHGAWADTASWKGVVLRLQADGYPTVAIPNPLRSLSGDAAYVRKFLRTLRGPLVLVGHSYGGAVVTNAARDVRTVRSLVYVNAMVPDEGESSASLPGKDSALYPDGNKVFRFVPDGTPRPGTDLYLTESVFRSDFARGLPADDVAVLADSQRPVTLRALSERSGRPGWKTIPSWYMIGTEDRIIPPSAQRRMAARANSRIEMFREGHLGLLSDPLSVVKMIERAANGRPLTARSSRG